MRHYLDNLHYSYTKTLYLTTPLQNSLEIFAIAGTQNTNKIKLIHLDLILDAPSPWTCPSSFMVFKGLLGYRTSVKATPRDIYLQTLPLPGSLTSVSKEHWTPVTLRKHQLRNHSLVQQDCWLNKTGMSYNAVTMSLAMLQAEALETKLTILCKGSLHFWCVHMNSDTPSNRGCCNKIFLDANHENFRTVVK